MDKNKKTIIIVVSIISVLILLCCAIATGLYFIGKAGDSTKITEAEQEAFVDAIGEALKDDEDNVDYDYEDSNDYDLPLAPYGYKWSTCTNMNSSFLTPDGWYKSEETTDGDEACFISREKYEGDDVFLMGLSVNMFEDIELRTGKTPEEYAYAFIQSIADTYDGEIDEVSDADFTGYGTAVTLGSGSDAVNVYYLALGSNTSDKVYTIWYEGPVAEWEDAWDKGETMLNDLVLEAN